MYVAVVRFEMGATADDQTLLALLLLVFIGRVVHTPIYVRVYEYEYEACRSPCCLLLAGVWGVWCVALRSQSKKKVIVFF